MTTMNKNDKYIQYITEKLDTRSLLEYFAKESSEITKAALETICVTELAKNTNYPPKVQEKIVKEEKNKALENLAEKIIDLNMVYTILAKKEPLAKIVEDNKDMLNYKWEDWAKLLGYQPDYSDAPYDGDTCYIVDPYTKEKYRKIKWQGTANNLWYLDAGLVCHTKEEAIAMLKALQQKD